MEKRRRENGIWKKGIWKMEVKVKAKVKVMSIRCVSEPQPLPFLGTLTLPYPVTLFPLSFFLILSFILYLSLYPIPYTPISLITLLPNKPITNHLAHHSSTSATLLAIGLPSTLCPFSVISTSSSTRIPPKSRKESTWS